MLGTYKETEEASVVERSKDGTTGGEAGELGRGHNMQTLKITVRTVD